MTVTEEGRSPRRGVRIVRVVVGVLLLVVLASVLKRLLIDGPSLAAGTRPEEPFDQRYVAHPWLAYLHILPGALYLFFAPIQLAYGFRSRHYPVHRRLGRILATAGILAGLFALVFGGRFAFGGLAEASATMVFGVWFVACLVVAVRAIRRHDIVSHRRWMIRAFATGMAVGTARLWLSLFAITGWLQFAPSFGPAFWLGFSTNVVAGELWLRAHPDPPETAARGGGGAAARGRAPARVGRHRRAAD